MASFAGPYPEIPSSPSIVGRHSERVTLQGFLERTRSGAGSLVLISGEAGIGKSTLVSMLAAQAREQRDIVLTGHCYDLSATPPYGPWLELARRYQPSDQLPPPPSFLTDADALASLPTREALYDAALAFFTTLAAQRNVILVLEDLHWADQASLELLRFISRETRNHPILLLATYRDDEVTRRRPLYRALPVLVRESRAERLELRPLPPHEVEEFVRLRYGEPGPDLERLIDYLLEYAEGNPLFTGEMLRSLERERILTLDGDCWSLDELHHAPVPSLIRQIVDTRLADLSVTTRSALQSAAVIGQTIPLWRWELISGSENVATAIVDGLEEQLLEATPDGDIVTFRHALFREAIYESLTFPHRRDLHRQVAEALTGFPRVEPEDVAFHFQQGGDERAFDWLVRAGLRAERGYALTAAIERYEAAAALAERTPDGAAIEAALMLRISRVLRLLDLRRALDYSEEAHRIALAAGSQRIAAHALLNLGVLFCHTNRMRAGLDAIRGGVRMMSESLHEPDVTEELTLSPLALEDRAEPVARANNTLALWQAAAGYYAEAVETATQPFRGDWREIAAAGLQISPERLPTESAESYHVIAFALAHLGQPADARLAINSAYSINRRLNLHNHGLQLAFIDLAAMHFPYRTTELAERESVAGYLNSLLESSPEAVAGPGTWAKSLLLFHQGKWSELRDLGQAANWRGPELLHRDIYVCVHAQLAWRMGSATSALDLVETVFPEGPVSEPGGNLHMFAAEIQRLAAEMALENGELDLSRRWLAMHKRWLDWNNSMLGRADELLLRARLHLAAGDLPAAELGAREALERASDPVQPIPLIGIDRFLGELARQAGTPDIAAQHLERSLDLAEACAMPFEIALSTLALARFRAENADPDGTKGLLRETLRICRELGAQPTFDRAVRLLEALEPGAARTSPTSLTQRELEVLGLLVQGMSDKAIADELYISPHTVMRHVAHILRKLNVESRTAAAAYAIRHHIV